MSRRATKKQVIGLEGSLANGITFAREQLKVSSAVSAGVTITAAALTALPNSSGLIPYTDATDFHASMMVVYNGVIVTVGQASGADIDAWPQGVAANGEFAMDEDLSIGDVLVLMKFTAGL